MQYVAFYVNYLPIFTLKSVKNLTEWFCTRCGQHPPTVRRENTTPNVEYKKTAFNGAVTILNHKHS